jgi:hypothetical protein
MVIGKIELGILIDLFGIYFFMDNTQWTLCRGILLQ